MNQRKRIFSPAIVISAIIIAVLLFVFLGSTIWLVLPAPGTLPTSTIELAIIPAPSATATISLLSPTLTPETILSIVNGVSVGAYVQITGTEGHGLNLHQNPGVDSPVVTVAMDNEVFEVVEGPQTVDDYVWWYLRSSYDSNRAGWAASNYLTIMATPQP